MKIRNILLITFFIVLIFAPQKALAVGASGSSAVFAKNEIQIEPDKRAKLLKKFLEQYNSPFSENAQTFVKEADKYNLDWKLLVAISGVESTFGEEIPYNCYNAWGWGIYGNNTKCFNSWDEAIVTISKGLREDYINNWGAKNVYQIGNLYAASPTWANRVVYFMAKINDFELSHPSDSLSLSL